MAKGKKKGGGDKKSETQEDSSQSNVPSEQPSTSTAEPEEDEGLTGKSRKQLRQQKKAAKQEASKNLKPLSDAASTTSDTSSRAQSEAPSEPAEPPKPEPKPEAKPEAKPEETIAEEFDGLGLLGPGKKRPNRRKKKTDGPQTDSGQAQPAGPAPTQGGPGPAPTQGGPGPAPTQGGPGPAPTQTWASPAPTGPVPEVTSTVNPPPGAAPWGAIPPGVGRGRGRGVSPQTPTPTTSDPPGFPTRSFPQPQVSHQPTPPAQTIPIYPVAQRQPGSAHSGRSQDGTLCRYKIPHKIPRDTIQCRRVTVLTNYLAMTFKSLEIARYDVAFKPDKPKKMLALVFQNVKNKHFPKELIAFDQIKNCYSLRPLPKITQAAPLNATVEITDPNQRTMKFEVIMKFTGMVDLGKIKTYMSTGASSLNHPTEEVQCIDVILRQGTLESYVKAGRQFFKRPNNPVDLTYGYEMWTGLFQSAIFTDKAFINIDVAHKGFPRSQSMIDALSKDFRLDPSRPLAGQKAFDVEYFSSFIKGLRVVATVLGPSNQKREFICNDIVDPPDRLFFTMTSDTDQKGRKMSVAEYFQREKKYTLKYPRLNCVWVGPRDKNIFFPMELLYVAPGQALNRQLNEFQVSNMVREAATPPGERLRKIEEVKSSMKYSTNADFKKFGLDISDKFHKVAAKVLNPPILEVGTGKTERPNRGQWQARTLLKPKPLECWGYIALETDQRNDNDNVIKTIMRTAQELGMGPKVPSMVLLNARMMELRRILLDALDKGIRFLMIIVSSRGRDYYHKVKQMAEREVGILTQCLKESTVRKMNPMTAKNILLKINSKLMGINQALEPKSLPRCLQGGGVMIVGADVTHPSPEQSNVPSIAAVTASMDPKCYIYNIELSVQTPKKEVIVEFEDMMLDHLKLYKERNQNELPKKIFVFRDGVSEGQFAQVLNCELQAIHNAYSIMSGGKRKPEVLFLLVQKRHHTRLFIEGSNYNVEPGTVVDKDIVHASELDFYLVSHQAIKGTARPTRYHAICNDGQIPDDEVEQLTFYLCHLYSRCMRSVSYPTPTYYAHLACFRARSLTHGEKFDNRELEKKPKRLHVLDKMLQFSRMFFV